MLYKCKPLLLLILLPQLANAAVMSEILIQNLEKELTQAYLTLQTRFALAIFTQNLVGVTNLLNLES